MLRKGHILAICVASVSLVTVLSIEAQQDYSIPSWVKNTALWWGQGDISDADFISGIKFLIEHQVMQVSDQKDQNQEYYINHLEKAKDDYEKQLDELWIKHIRLEKENENLKRQVDDLQYSLSYPQQDNDLESLLNQLIESDTLKPTTTIEDQTIYWNFYDSKGYQYTWNLPIETYENLVSSGGYYDLLTFELPDGRLAEVGDMTAFVTRGFTEVIDDIYDNAIDEDDFIYEVWYITSQLTTYSTEIGEYPRYALETLSRGGGDCEDTAILIADMLRSSSHTRNWEIQFVYFDSDYPERPRSVNHVAVAVDTGKNNYIIESTAKTTDEMNSWAGTEIFGWWYDV